MDLFIGVDDMLCVCCRFLRMRKLKF